MEKQNIFEQPTVQAPETIVAPKWTNPLREQALNLMAQHSQSGILKFVQYDVQPDLQNLECYQITLFNNTVTKAFIAYYYQDSTPQFRLTIHLTTENFNNE
jgi:hypothetical protein